MAADLFARLAAAFRPDACPRCAFAGGQRGPVFVEVAAGEAPPELPAPRAGCTRCPPFPLVVVNVPAEPPPAADHT